MGDVCADLGSMPEGRGRTRLWNYLTPLGA